MNEPAHNNLVHRSTDTDRGVTTITLDSPANRNALSAQLLRELRGHLTEAIADDATRVIVLDHTGPVFCAGMDLKEARGGVSESQGTHFPALLEQLWSSPKPVVAKLAGPARAGGIGIVAACDVAIAADNATFAFSEVRIGVVPAMISVTVLPRLAPRQAHELFLTGETFDAQRAANIGLINRAVPADRLAEEVARYAEMLTLGAPNAIAATKALLADRSTSTYQTTTKTTAETTATQGIQLHEEAEAPGAMTPHKETAQATATHEGAAQVAATHDETPQVTATHEETPQATATHEETAQITAAYDETPQATAVHEEAAQVTATHEETPQATAMHDETAQVIATHDETPQATATHEEAGQVTAMHEEFTRMRRLSEKHFASDEGREGMRAFAEKRPPRWVPKPSE